MAAKDIADIRKLTIHRRATAARLRRLIPTVLVGTSALAGTGGLVAWIGSQPGVAAAHPAPAGPPTTNEAPALTALRNALQADQSQVRSLESAVARLAAQQASEKAATARGGAGAAAPSGTGGSGQVGAVAAPAAAASLPAVPVLQPITVAAAPPPPTNATSGASHAVP